MRTITVKVLKYPELDDDAKEKARQDAAVAWGYLWGDEALDSIKALAKHFGCTLRNYSVDWFDCSPSHVEFDCDELDEAEIADRLAAMGTFDPQTFKGHGECKLTGYCADDDAIDGFRQSWHTGERDLSELMDAAFDSWLKAAQADCQSFYDDEDDAFADHCEANGYEFYESGKMA